MNASKSTFVLARTPVRLLPIVPKRLSLASNDDIASLLFAKLEKIRWATYHWQEADNSLWMKELRYKKGYERPVRLDRMFKVVDYSLHDRLAFPLGSCTACSSKRKKISALQIGTLQSHCVRRKYVTNNTRWIWKHRVRLSGHIGS